MRYILDHYYAVNHKEFCMVVESDRLYSKWLTKEKVSVIRNILISK